MPSNGGSEFQAHVVAAGIALVNLPIRITAEAYSRISTVSNLWLVCAVTVALETNLVFVDRWADPNSRGSYSAHVVQITINRGRRSGCWIRGMGIMTIKTFGMTRYAR